jgi:hypothetical protein
MDSGVVVEVGVKVGSDVASRVGIEVESRAADSVPSTRSETRQDCSRASRLI